METPPRGRLSSRALDTTPPNRRAHSREPVYIQDELPLPLASPAPWKLSYGHPSMLRGAGSDGSTDSDSERELSSPRWTSNPRRRERDLRLSAMVPCEEGSEEDEDEEEPKEEGNRREPPREATTPVHSPLPSPEATPSRTPLRTPAGKRSPSASGMTPGKTPARTPRKTPGRTPGRTPSRRIQKQSLRTPKAKHAFGRRPCTRSSTRVGLRPCTRSQIRGRLQSLCLSPRKRPKRN